MSNVNEDGIATPDEDNAVDPDVWAAAMAESISQGIGVRLKKQEARGGLKARTDNVEVGPDNDVVPVAIGVGGYANGITLAGGYATAEVAGLYLLTARATSFISDNIPVDANLWLNGEVIESQSFSATPTAYATTLMVTPVFLEEGDTFYMTLGVGGGGSGPVTITNTALTATLIYAT